MSHHNTTDSTNDIAIIGLAGRFPGAKNIDEFWQNLEDGLETISFFSDEELRATGVDPSELNHPNYVKAKGILDEVDLFDASFFGFNPREAEVIDPQQRLFLECAWEALENAGYDPETHQGAIGVYAGSSMNTYIYNLFSNPDLVATVGGYQIMIGNDKDFVPTRVSYKLNLTGPSVNIQTACSTSLVSIQFACQGLLDYQCDMALAGGVSVTFPHKTGYLYQEGMILSPDGHCRAFDAEAQGIVGGEGVGIVVLKRLEDALEDGDYIYAVIKGSAINNDGSLKVGYTAPSVDGQAEAIATAQALAQVEPETITYIEAHGTGTSLGDPIEIAALTEVFRANTEAKGYCAIGSVKTNIGHLDAAAGVAGLIKTTLALQHKQIPPSLHFKQPNPKIDFANSPFYVNTELAKWKTNGTPRRAGVSSFGIGGTNAHVVLEEAPPLEVGGASRPWQLLLLSAKTNTALETATRNLVEHFKQQPNLNLADAAYTLQVGRQAFNHKRFVLCQDIDDAVKALKTLDPKRVFSTTQETAHHQPVVFMFTGQGAQYVQMGRDLYQSEPTFRKHVDFCAEFLKPHLGLDLREALYPPEENQDMATEQLGQTSITQPALFVVEYALAQLWEQWGIQPQAMIGHSIGEYVAACLAGVFSLEDALTLVAARGRLMQELPGGAMLAVPLSETQLRPLLDQTLSLAAINGPSLCVVSGSYQAIDAFEAKLTQQNINARRLHTSHAFHSEMMEPILAPFIEQFKSITLQPPQVPFISNVTGTWITPAEATDPAYWAKHLRQTVRFAQGASELLKGSNRVLLEVGPGRTLSSLVRQVPDKSTQQVILTSLRHPQAQGSDSEFILNSLGQLWLAGVRPDWSGFYAHEQRQRMPLPTYPFERQRYWVEPKKQNGETTNGPISVYKKSDIADWFYLPSWKRSAPPQLSGQRIQTDQKLNCLVFVDEYGLGSKIVKQLEQDGHHVTTVSVGEQFSKVGDGAYTLNPQTHDEYDRLIKELHTLDKVPDTIIHLWSVTSNKDQLVEFELLIESESLGFYSLLFLAQALGEYAPTATIQIQVVSNNIHEVTGEEKLYPEKATILGPSLVIPLEYPHILCRNIDLVLPESDSVAERKLVNQLITELLVTSSEPIVAYRGQYRWIQTFAATQLVKDSKRSTLLKQGGVYLVTGGLGGIGLVLAQYLAQTAQARLVLTGRSSFPDKAEWQQWLATHDEQDSISQKIQRVQTLEKLGAEVLIINADVANLEQMQAVITQTHQRFGNIDGVIHAAGIAGGGMIQLKKIADSAAVLSSKVNGTLVLDTVLSDENLDFFVLCSSINSVLTTFGQVDYCAANTFLDAFAHYYNAKNGTTCISVNWDTWQEVGMAVETEVPQHLQQSKEENLKHGLLNKEGQDAFERILANPLPQVVVSTQDFNILIEQSRASILLPTLDTFEAENLSSSFPEASGTKQPKEMRSSSQYPRPNLSNAYVAPRNELEEKVVEIWQTLLGIEGVGIHDNFFELGGHSLLATQIVSRLRATLNVEVPLRSLFEATTAAELAEHLETILLAIQTPSEAALDDREEIEI